MASGVSAALLRTFISAGIAPSADTVTFAPLAVDAKPESLRQVLEELRRREPRDAERAELCAAMLVVAELNTWGHNLEEELRSMMQNVDRATIMKSRTLREAFETGKEEGIEKGIEKGRRGAIEKMLQGLLMRRMHRDLTPDEQAALSNRAATLDDEQASAVLDLDADALRAWLFGPDAE